MTQPARALHPVAWWLWALGLAAAASRTLNPLLLGAIIAVAALVVAARRSEAPWGASFRAFLVLGMFVLGVRLVFEVLFGAPVPGTTILTLPELTLPSWMAGAQLGGAVTLEALVAAVYAGLQLVAILACVGAANALANPTRLLKSVPGALYEVGVAVVVALTLVPSALAHLQRVREARRLRGRSSRGSASGWPGRPCRCSRALWSAHCRWRRRWTPAASVASTRSHPGQRRVTTAVTVTGLLAILVGGYALLDAGTSVGVAMATLGAGVALTLVGLRRANRRAVRTVYRPDPWRWPEHTTVASGLLAAGVYAAVASLDPTAMLPATSPLVWPELPLLPLLATLLAAAPAWVTPPVPRDATAAAPRPAPELAAVAA